MDYENYKITDFILDEYFQEWVLNPGRETEKFWNDWLRENPEKEAMLKEARQAILHIQFKEYLPEEAQKARVWKNINRLKSAGKGAGQKMVVMRHGHPARKVVERKRMWPGIAAALAVLVIAGGLYYLNFMATQKVVLSTDYGQTKVAMLADGSEVHLNANSRISYKAGWKPGALRELWLEGEAYFSVKHQADDQKFIVHTQGLQVEVLGTEFNVKNRKDLTSVVLLTGKVKLEAPGVQDTAEYIMQPGELVQFAAVSQKMESRKVSPEQYVSWKDHELRFVDTNIAEIAQIIEENYGYEVMLDDIAMNNLKFTGTVPSQSIDYLLVALSESFQMHVKKNENVIRFSYRNN